MYYAILQKGKLNGASQCICSGDGIEQIEITEEIYKEIEKYEFKENKIQKIENYDEKVKKQQRKQEIIEELDKIDLQSIRAIRTSDLMKMAEYEASAEKLRKELQELGV